MDDDNDVVIFGGGDTASGVHSQQHHGIQPGRRKHTGTSTVWFVEDHVVSSHTAHCVTAQRPSTPYVKDHSILSATDLFEDLSGEAAVGLLTKRPSASPGQADQFEDQLRVSEVFDYLPRVSGSLSSVEASFGIPTTSRPGRAMQNSTIAFGRRQHHQLGGAPQQSDDLEMQNLGQQWRLSREKSRAVLFCTNDYTVTFLDSNDTISM